MRKDSKTEALRWFTQAEEELKDAKYLMEAKRYYLSLFLCQQSAEKALKAFIYMYEEDSIFSHSVTTILKLANSIDPDFKTLEGANRLDDYYIPTRYPNGLPGGIPAQYYADPDEVKRALIWSEKIINLVREKLKNRGVIMFEIGWFSSGRDEAALELLQVVHNEIKRGSINGRISYVFVTREKGEKPESDRFIDFAEGLGLDVICLSHRNFEPEIRKAGLEESRKLGKDSQILIDWRNKYDRVAMEMLSKYDPDIIVLAGYMLIVSPDMCQKYKMINLHPALPGGPKGTWQEVIWQLLEEKAEKTGVMMHLVIPELDAGPAITFCEFSISDDDMKPLWDQWNNKRKKKSLQEIQKSEGENEPLFKEIRQRGLEREFPLIIATIKAASQGKFSIINRQVIAQGRKLENGFDLTEEIEEIVKT